MQDHERESEDEGFGYIANCFGKVLPSWLQFSVYLVVLRTDGWAPPCRTGGLVEKQPAHRRISHVISG